MERDGLLSVEGDRHLELSEAGRAMATRVMRKHRLAECLLVEIIGLEWEDVHAEACRWEHVMSERVERRILELLKNPTVSPYGNPIPGLEELDRDSASADLSGLLTLDKVGGESSTRVTVARIGEPIQNDAALMASLHRAGVVPSATVKVVASPGGVLVGSAGEYAELDAATASHVFVSKG
jgi:DtxR family Mn-dependent transcriptional regulator